MRRDHARVRRVELVGQTFMLQLLIDFINPFGDDQRGAFCPFCQEIPHRAADRASHSDRLARLLANRELAGDLANRVRVTNADSRASILSRTPQQDVPRWIHKIHDLLNQCNVLPLKRAGLIRNA